MIYLKIYFQNYKYKFFMKIKINILEEKIGVIRHDTPTNSPN